MNDKTPTLDEWLDENFGQRGVGGFCDACGEDWKELPFGWELKDIRGVGKEYPNVRYWFCSKECGEKISQEIRNSTRYQKTRTDS